MRINPKQKKSNLLFFNNIALILISVSLIFLMSSCNYYMSPQKKVYNGTLSTDKEIKIPINIHRNTEIYLVKAEFFGKNANIDISGEVVNEDDDTLYEFDKELYHESGYDSDGYWSESSGDLVARLVFDKKGKYFIKLSDASIYRNDKNQAAKITVSKINGSYIPHLVAGIWILLAGFILFYYKNAEYVNSLFYSVGETVSEYGEED